MLTCIIDFIKIIDFAGLENGSSGGPRFNSQYPHANPKLSVTPVPDDLMFSHKHTCQQNTSARKI